MNHNSPKEKISEYIAARGSATNSELAAFLGISRQAVHVHLRTLISAGKLLKTGSTKSSRYHIATSSKVLGTFARTLDLAALDESVIYTRVATVLNLRRLLRPNVESIAHYAFTEILNNAIDHSEAPKCSVRVILDSEKLRFEIRESGIGIFHSISQKLHLEDEHAALVEMLKGKTTTMPEAHSGEGIFFTSKAADRLVIYSHKIEIEWKRPVDDVFVSTPRFRKGTTVTFEIRRDARTKLEDVFSAYAPEEYDFQFQRTHVLVKLLRAQYISRSEAKRLVVNLDKFREVGIDFKDVDRLGQGFADEVFRVFAANHAETMVYAKNANPSVAALVRHVGGRVI